jgi:hypothetical protein
VVGILRNRFGTYEPTPSGDIMGLGTVDSDAEGGNGSHGGGRDRHYGRDGCDGMMDTVVDQRV